MKNISETEKAYIAGLIDGEGCIGIDKTISKSNNCEHDFKLRIIITNTDFDVICWIKEITGLGCVYKYQKAFKANWRPVHRWQVVSDGAKEIIIETLPYLRIKKQLAAACLSFPKFTKGHYRTAEEFAAQVEKYMLIRTFNVRGKLRS